MCGSKKYVFFNLVGKRYGHLRRPRGSRGGYKHKKARNIINEQNACDAAMASEAVDAGPAAVAAGAGHADASAGNDAAPRWFEIHLVEVSPGDFVNEHGEQYDAYFRLVV